MSADAVAELRAWVAVVAAGVVEERSAISVEPVGRLGRSTLVLLLHVAPDDTAYIIAETAHSSPRCVHWSPQPARAWDLAE
jgi:hypothetical protein